MTKDYGTSCVIQLFSNVLFVIHSLPIHRHHEISKARVADSPDKERAILSAEPERDAVFRDGGKTIGDIPVIEVALKRLSGKRGGEGGGAFAKFATAS